MAKSGDQFIRENKITLIIIGILILAYYIYRQGKRVGSESFVALPDNGQGIPAGWTPRATTQKMVEAMNPSGISWLTATDGTDEDMIFLSLDPLTRDQRTAVYNDYIVLTGDNLLDDFRSELSGADLSRALAYFDHILQGGNRIGRILVNFSSGIERTGRAIINFEDI